MSQSPADQGVEKANTDIQALAQGLDPVNKNKLTTDLWGLEQKPSVLRIFISGHFFAEDHLASDCE